MLREARQNIARMIGCDPLEIVFTSGGSEANNLAFHSVLTGGPMNGRDRVMVSAVEHPSVRKTAEDWSRLGFSVDVIPVSRDGVLDLEFVRAHLSERTALVSVMLANNETGHIFPVSAVAELAHAVGARVHCDAVQALGKIPVNVRELGADFVTFSGHKFYALKGVGLLYARKGTSVRSLIHGGGQERGRRAGTENALAIASLGFMCGMKDQVEVQGLRLRGLRDHLESRIVNEIGGALLTGAEGNRLPGTSNLTLAGVDGETLLMNLDVRGFAVSTGAACSSGNPEPSPVLLAIGLSRAEAQSSLRLSLGWGTTEDEVNEFVDVLKSVVERLRGLNRSQEKVV